MNRPRAAPTSPIECVGQPWLSLRPLLDRFSFRWGLVFLGLARTDFIRNSGDKAVIFRAAGQDYNEPIFGDDVFADILAVIAATHLHDHNDFAKLAVHLDITEPDNVIGEKRNRIVTKGELNK